MIGLVAATRRGADLAAHLEAAWPDARRFEGRPADAIAQAWPACDGLVLFMAAGAAVRLIARHLTDKRRDPGVVTVDDAGRFAVALCGGHEGGANALANRVAGALGAQPVTTTATDALELPSLEALGADLGFRLDPRSDVAGVGAALVSGERVALVEDQRWPLPPMPGNVERTGLAAPPCVVVTDRETDITARMVVHRPPSLVVGVGCSRGVSADEILALVDDAFADAGLSSLSIAEVRSVDAKRNEPGLLEAAGRRRWPLSFVAADILAGVAVPNPSEKAARAVGTPSVAEAAALLDGGELLVPKRRSAAATVAVVRRVPRGRLAIVGIGPGDPSLVPPLAREALAAAEVVVGMDAYVERIRPYLRPGTAVKALPVGDEVRRAQLAVEAASSGASVALVSGGDAGVYGMASPALELAPPTIDVQCIPGITAAVAVAALLGAPLGHDHCAISLSDLLTPWALIRQRIEAAAAADFVLVLYNPRSRNRYWQFNEARTLLLACRASNTPVGVVTDAFRQGQRVTLTTLSDLDPEGVGMTATVIVGSSRTRVVHGRMVTPRGYG